MAAAGKGGRVSRKAKRPERFAQIPLEVLESDAFRWLPPFPVRVLVALAAKFNGYNNGGIELTARDAEQFGISEDELFAGIGLLILAGLVRRTVEARRRSGKGAPARYAITWRTIGDFPRFNLVPTVTPTRDWQRFEAPFEAARTVRAAKRALGHQKRRPSRLHTLPPEYKRVPGTRRVKNPDMTGHAQGEKESFTGHAQGEAPGTRRVKKYRVSPLRIVTGARETSRGTSDEPSREKYD